MRWHSVAIGLALLPASLLSEPRGALTCSDALEQVETLKTMSPVYKLTGKDQRHFIEDADRPAEIARLQKIIAASCSANPTERADQEAQARRLHQALSPACAVERDTLAAMELPNSHESRDAIETKRKLVRDKCPAVDSAPSRYTQAQSRQRVQRPGVIVRRARCCASCANM